MYFSHVHQPPELKTVKRKNQIRLHKQIQLARYRLVKTKHWNKHIVYLMHFFQLFGRQMALPAPMAAWAQRTAEGAGAQVPKVAPVLQVSFCLLRFHWQASAKFQCLSQISYWRNCIFPNNTKWQQIRSLLVAYLCTCSATLHCLHSAGR